MFHLPTTKEYLIRSKTVRKLYIAPNVITALTRFMHDHPNQPVISVHEYPAETDEIPM